ncbi:MAG: glutathione S-transferase N-terminal domain-containing protein [Octadecabacter sp.]|nr:glutathione S-transferase N-terminal domain-containing protein [Octadecabacter sp.]
MLTIYSVPVAVYCAKLRIMLRYKFIQFEQLSPPGGYGSDAYRGIVPSGNLPAMLHDGFMLSDSEAIAEYLEETFHDVPMLPNTVKLRAKAREFSRLHDTRLEPAVRAMYPQVAHLTRDENVVQIGGLAISKHLSSLELLLAANPLDEHKLWLCDCGFAVTFAWIRAFQNALNLPVEWPQIVSDYETRLKGFKVVFDELEAYRSAMDAYLEKAKPS